MSVESAGALLTFSVIQSKFGDNFVVLARLLCWHVFVAGMRVIKRVTMCKWALIESVFNGLVFYLVQWYHPKQCLQKVKSNPTDKQT